VDGTRGGRSFTNGNIYAPVRERPPTLSGKKGDRLPREGRKKSRSLRLSPPQRKPSPLSKKRKRTTPPWEGEGAEKTSSCIRKGEEGRGSYLFKKKKANYVSSRKRLIWEGKGEGSLSLHPEGRKKKKRNLKALNARPDKKESYVIIWRGGARRTKGRKREGVS